MSATSTLPTLLIIDQSLVQAKAAHEATEKLYSSIEQLSGHLVDVTKERTLTTHEVIALNRLETVLDAYTAYMETIL